MVCSFSGLILLGLLGVGGGDECSIDWEGEISLVEDWVIDQSDVHMVGLLLGLIYLDDLSICLKKRVKSLLNRLGKSPCEDVGQLLLEELLEVSEQDLNGN